ncbi:hypothetical protein K461DRAFT_272237 [Myriangium duriaei CBS 260.36]|uniref:F-box domain-containing protein n=1 Tax=Myriangium duriaei CBS 260.36 TaxID=1168546 RepID=A0A9P4IQ63_9PEZI|nr:hypothetical protein K461DRAFT_272237 [Myriangium duriaei CBS 260.36]
MERSNCLQRINELPDELLQNILACLQYDPISLSQARLVNKKWDDFASDLFWRHPPSCAILKVARHKRQERANQIRSLFFHHRTADRDLRVYSGLDLNQLTDLTFHFVSKPHYLTTADLQAFIRPSLKHLSILNSDWEGTNDFKFVLARCPDLRTLIYAPRPEASGPPIDPNDLPFFLQNCTRLETLEMGRTLAEQTDPSLVYHFLSCENLRDLRMQGHVFDMPTLHQAIQDQRMLPQLKSFSIVNPARQIINVLRYMPCLTELVITTAVDDDISELFVAIAQLEDLRKLHLTFSNQSGVLSTDIMLLSRLQHLRTLRIVHQGG